MYADLNRKVCKKCREEKLLSEFQKDCKRKDGFSNQCKKCKNERRKQPHYREYDKAYNRQYREKHIHRLKERDRKHNLRRNFGITAEQYDALSALQNHQCKICSGINDRRKKKLCVDHCHSTGRIRGLLCDNCNRGVGLLKDSIEILNNAIKYLQDSELLDKKLAG